MSNTLPVDGAVPQSGRRPDRYEWSLGIFAFACFRCYTETSMTIDKPSPVIPRTPQQSLWLSSGVLTHVVDPLPSSGPSPDVVTISINQHKDIPAYKPLDNTPSLPTEMSAQSITSSLDSVLYADTQIFIPNITFGKVVKVYDADTITIANHLTIGGTQSTEIYRFQVRLNGIDSPEIKSKNATTKELAKKARDALSNMIFWKIVELKNVKLEKYGRLLADVYLGDIHLNQWLIDNNYAVRYDGGTKQIPDEWEA